ncbi:MAG TPA: glycosyltransferase family 2 protein [Candidatus Acidoferrales bacterium]|nr:glycosyltransferase family 2 protein [Candidatus Acidoferrales bacterium]
MKVSALIPTFNRRDYFSRAIESVLAQTLPVDEVIIVDDGSTDGTAEFIQERYAKQVRLIRQENTGVSGARLRAIREACGDWVAFLDSDDEWVPERNCLLTEAARSVPPDVAWIFGDVRLIHDEGDGDTIFSRFGLRLDRSVQVIQDSMSVQYPFQFGLLQGSLIRRRELLEVGAFHAGLNHSEDFLAGVQVACRCKFAAVQPVVTRMHRTSDLKGSSLDLAGRNSPDYYRARMMAYSLIQQSGREGRWGEYYAEAVRGLCKSLAARGKGIRRTSLEQFRYGLTGKAIAFECAAVLGSPGMRLWQSIGRLSRGIRGQAETAHFEIGWNS